MLRALTKYNQSLWFLIFGLYFCVKIFLGFQVQNRIWIDEVWAVYAPSFQFATDQAMKIVPADEYGLRSWVMPVLLGLLQKTFWSLGIHPGPSTLVLVRILFALLNFIGILYLLKFVAREFSLTSWRWLLPFVFLSIPEFLHYGQTAELNVLGFPFLIIGLTSLLNSSSSDQSNFKTRIAMVMLVFSGLVRFQYGLFPAFLFLYFIFLGLRQKAFELFIIGIALLVFDGILNSHFYGHPSLPLYTYLVSNLSGRADQFGTMPWYKGLEMIWRLSTEPALFAFLISLPFIIKTSPFLTLSTIVFTLIHLLIGHKEIRFFYFPAVIFAALACGTIISNLEGNSKIKKHSALFIAIAIVLSSIVRGTTKTEWRSFEVPSILETRAGQEPDILGLMAIGFKGIEFGSQYFIQKNIPYQFTESLDEMKNRFLKNEFKIENYSHLIIKNSLNVHCQKLIINTEEATLYYCSQAELTAILK